MRIVTRQVIEKVCCEKMQEMLDEEIITHNVLKPISGHNGWNFYWGDKVIFYCPWCGESCV